jgi:alpha-tubulin suppressor-like RCC1 family protein
VGTSRCVASVSLAVALLAFGVATAPAATAAAPQVSVGDASAVEGTYSRMRIRFPITLDTPATTATKVSWRTFDGTAAAPSDYVMKLEGTSTIRTGKTSTLATVWVKNDPFVEPSETFMLQITSVTPGISIADGTGTGTIINDDSSPPTVRIDDASALEGDDGSTTLRLRIRLSPVVYGPVTVTWATSDGDAVAPGDYRAQTTGKTNFPRAKNIRDAVIKLRGDVLAEGSESFRVTITGVSVPGIDVADGVAIATIVDDDIIEPAPAGTLWAWGDNAFGQTGLGSLQMLLTPARVRPDTDWAQVSGGHPRTLALKTDGSLWQWGSPSPNTPVRVGTDRDWVGISGGDPVLATKADGSLWSWGSDSTIPTRVDLATDWRSATSCFGFQLAIKTDGTLWAWGRNEGYQLGLGDQVNRLTPTQVGGGTNWAEARCGYFFAIARTAGGTLWSWGEGSFGALGHGDSADRSTPTQIGTRSDWVQVAPSSYSAAAVTADGHLFTWGFNGSGELGLGDTTSRYEPAQVGTETNWAAADGGEMAMLGLRTDGTLWSWGANASGQLGLGDTTARRVPTRVGAGTNWARLSNGSARFAIRG